MSALGPGTLLALALLSPPPSAVGAADPAPPLARDRCPDTVFMSHMQSAAPVSSTHPCLRHGTLLLVGGGGGDREIYARFVALAGGKSARIVVIPTASVNSSDSAVVRELGHRIAEVLRVPGVTILHTVSRAEADSPPFVEPLRRATGVWIPGGEAAWLEDSYMGTRTETELIALLERGGVIGGTSAGALIWGSKALLYRPRPDAAAHPIEESQEVLIGNLHETTLGVLRNVLVAPHFTELKCAAALERVLPPNPGLLGIGIDEVTAIEVHADAFTVLGRGTVSVYDGRHPKAPPRVLRRGDHYDIARRLAE